MGDEGQGEAMVRARFRVEAAGVCLQSPQRNLVTVCGRWAGRDGGIGHGKRRSRTGLARVGGAFGWPDGGSVADGRSQAGSGMARSRARAQLNFSAQGQRSGRCRVNRRAERVSRPARAKNRRRRVLVGHDLLTQAEPSIRVHRWIRAKTRPL